MQSLEKTKVIKSNEDPNSEGIVDTISDLLSTGKSVVDLVSDISSGNLVRVLEDAPKTIAKVVETGQHIFNTETTVSETVKDEISKQLDTKPTTKDSILEAMPVITTTQIPSSFASLFQNAPTTMYTEQVGFRGSKSAIRVSGSNQFSSGQYHPTSSSTLYTSYYSSLYATGNPIFGSRLAAMAALYQFFYIEGFDVFYVPNQPTSQPGTFYITFHDGATQIFPTPSVSQISQNERFDAISAYTSGSIKWTTFDPYGRYYTTDVATGVDQRWYSPGQIGIYSLGNNVTNYPGLPGQFYVTYRIILYGAMFSALDYNDRFHKVLFESFLSQFLFYERHNYIDLLATIVTSTWQLLEDKRGKYLTWKDYLADSEKAIDGWCQTHITEEVFEDDPFNPGLVIAISKHIRNQLSDLRKAFYALVPKLILLEDFPLFLNSITKFKPDPILKRLLIADYFLLKSLDTYRATYRDSDIDFGSFNLLDLSFFKKLPALRFPKIDNSVNRVQSQMKVSVERSQPQQLRKSGKSSRKLVSPNRGLGKPTVKTNPKTVVKLLIPKKPVQQPLSNKGGNSGKSKKK